MVASAPFKDRELNGKLLLEELSDLRHAQVPQKDLDDCVATLKVLEGCAAAEASQRLKAIASQRFAHQPALAGLLVRWAGKLKTELDLSLLLAHFHRLALTSAILVALRRASKRLPKGG